LASDLTLAWAATCLATSALSVALAVF